MATPYWIQVLYAYRNTLFIVLTPLLLLPIPLAIPGTEAACGFTILWMATWWITGAVPLGVTSFLPLIVFPLSGIMTGAEVSQAYFKDTTWLFIGGLIIALSVETTGLHKRIALRVLLLVGTKPRCLMLGFMANTFFLSMWISNTATTAMMLPIVEAVFKELKEDGKRQFLKNSPDHDNKSISNVPKTGVTSFSTTNEKGEDNFGYESNEKDVESIKKETDTDIAVQFDTNNGEHEETEEEFERRMDNLIKGITLCVPYSASIGGTATLTGTGPNLVLSGQFDILFPDATQHLSFGTWLAYSLPGALTMLVCAYIWLSGFYLGFNFFSDSCFGKKNQGELNAQRVIRSEYKKIGEMTWGEGTVLTLFTSTALLWFFREPGFIPGWAILFEDGYVTDGTVSMTMATLLFILPSERPNILKRSTGDGEIKGPVKPILDWPTVDRMFPWNILFLLAGGFALADGATVSGFSQWMGDLLSFLGGIETWAICLVVTIIVCLFTECSSNTATASLFIPILARLAQTLEVHPIYLMVPPILASSMAFMLPVATPPNAIAFSYGHLKVIDLVKAGWVLNILGVVVISIFINTYGMSYFDLYSFPEWAALPSSELTTMAPINVTGDF